MNRIAVQPILNHQQLKQQLRVLIAERDRKGTLIVTEVERVYNMVRHPGTLVKKMTGELASDKDFKGDLFKIGFSLATNLLTSRFSGAGGLGTIASILIDRFGGGNGKGIFRKLGGALMKLVPWKKS